MMCSLLVAHAGMNPAGMVLAPQAMGPGVTAMAVNIAPPPPGMMAAPPGMLPVAAIPRPPMTAAGPLAAAGKPGVPSDRHADQRPGGLGPHPPPRGVKGPGDRDVAQQMVMQAQQQLQGHAATLPPQHPPSMRGVVMTPAGPSAVGMVPQPGGPNSMPLGMTGQPVEGIPGQPGVPPSPPMPSGPVPVVAMSGVPPTMHHPRADGAAAVPQMVAAVPGMPGVPMQQPMPPMMHRGAPQGPDGYNRPDHRGQEGLRMHK